MWTKRARDLIGAFVIGNRVLDLIAPRQRVFLWLFGPKRLRKLILWFADHPRAMRLRGVVRIGTGIWAGPKAVSGSFPTFLLALTLVH